VLTAALFGLGASSAPVIGAVAGARWSPPKRVTGMLLAFGRGALIIALAFELFEEAFALAGAVQRVWVIDKRYRTEVCHRARK